MEYLFDTKRNTAKDKELLKQALKANADALYKRAYEKTGNQADALNVVKSVVKLAHKNPPDGLSDADILARLNELIDDQCNRLTGERNRHSEVSASNDAFVDTPIISQTEIRRTEAYNAGTQSNAYKLEEDEWLKELKERRRKLLEQEESETKSKKGSGIALVIVYLAAAAAIVLLINLLSNLGFFS